MRHPAYTESALWNLRARCQKNGVAPAFVKQNSKLMVCEIKFLRWIEDRDCLVREEVEKLEREKHLIGQKIESAAHSNSPTHKNLTLKSKTGANTLPNQLELFAGI